MRSLIAFLGFLIISFSVRSFAAAPAMVYEGYYSISGSAAPDGAYAVSVSVYGNSGADCLLYSENQNPSLVGGNFAFKVGQGTTPTNYGTVSSLQQAFASSVPLTGNASCAFDPTIPTARRFLRISVAGNVVGDVDVTDAPRAWWADKSGDTEKIAGRAVSTGPPAGNDILSYNSGTTSWGPVAPSSLSFTPAQISGTIPLSQGGTGQTNAISALNALLPSQSSNDGKVLQTDGTNASWVTSSLANTAVAPGSYGSATQVATFTVDAQGRLTSAANATITGVAPGGPASGDLSGTYPFPSLASASVTAAKIANNAVGVTHLSTSGAATGQTYRYSGTAWTIAKLPYTDLTNSASASPWPGTSCASGEFIIWQSVSDSFACSPLTGAQVNAALGYTAADASSYVAKAGDLMTGTLTLSAGGIRVYAGNVGIGTTSAVTRLEVAGTIKVADGAESCASPSNGGMIRYNTGNLQYCNGSSWQTVSAGGAGLTSLGGQTGSSQTFAAGTTGLSPAISSAGSVHTLNVPLASGAGVTSGTISKTEYDTFNNKLSAVSNAASLANTKIWVGDGTGKAQEVSVSGDGTLSAAGALTVTASVPATASSLPKRDASGALFATTFSSGTVLNGNLVLDSTLNATKGSVLVNPYGGNVGIGTTNPGSTLDVNGALTVRAMGAPLNAPVSQGRIYFDSTANKFRVSQNGGSYVDLVSAGGAPAGATNEIQFNSGGGSFASNSNFFWDNTNFRLGIGTNLPSDPLTVFSSNPDLAKFSTNTTDGKITLAQSNGASSILTSYSSLKNKIHIDAGNNGGIKELTVVSDGNVGIGTDSPVANLQVSSGTGTGTLVQVDTSLTNGSSALALADSTGSNSLLVRKFGTGATGTISGVNVAGLNQLTGAAGPMLVGTLSSAPIVFTTNNTEKIRIDLAGNVGIGSTAPSMKLDVIGDMRTSGCLYYNGGSTGTCASDERIKTDVHAFDLGLESLLGINPVNFKYNGLGGLQNDGKEQLGVIAQQIEKTAPELVERRMVTLHPGDQEKTEIKIVNYGAFTYVLINAVKEIYNQLVGTKEDVSNLKSQISDLQRDNAALRVWACTKDPSAPFCK